MWRSVKRKTCAILISVILLCSACTFLGYNIARGQSSSLSPLTLNAGPVPGAVTYTVFGDGSGNYYIKDQYGAIQTSWTSTNFGTTFNDAAAAITSGGSILVQPGTYTGNIVVPNGDTAVCLMGVDLTGTLTIGVAATHNSIGSIITGGAIHGLVKVLNSDFVTLDTLQTSGGLEINGQESEYGGHSSFTRLVNVVTSNAGGTGFLVDDGGKFMRINSLYIYSSQKGFAIDGDENVVDDITMEGAFTVNSTLTDYGGKYYIILGGSGTGGSLDASTSWENDISIMSVGSTDGIVAFGNNNIWSSTPVSPLYIKFENSFPTGAISTGTWVNTGLYGNGTIYATYTLCQEFGSASNPRIQDINATAIQIAFDGGGTQYFLVTCAGHPP